MNKKDKDKNNLSNKENWWKKTFKKKNKNKKGF